jgi:cytochrome c553
MRFLTFALLASLLSFAGNAPADLGPLAWDQPSQTNHVQPNAVGAHFIFKVRNVSASTVVIDDVKPSCGCTVAKLPSKPWKLAPKESGQFDAVVDLRGKRGTLYKTIDVLSPTAPTILQLVIEIPEATNKLSKEMANRVWGQQLAATDRQAVFTKTECLMCHLRPAFGKSGGQLYQVTCGICHEAKHRATMVPDLHSLKTPIDANYWRTWITYGKPGTLMPAFAATERGPLDDAQINSLIAYMTSAFPRPIKSTAK